MARETQHALAERLIATTEETDRRVSAIVREVDERQLDWTPPAGGWSIGQVLEHLCVANDSYLERVRPLVRDGRARRVDPGAVTWRPTFVGGLLVRSFESPRKMPAPKIYRVGPTPRPRVADEFLRRERELVELIREGTSIDWRRTRLASPVSGFIRVNLGDAFHVLVAHSRRHLGQIERIRGSAGFPMAARV
jgi:hypothetical protein